MADVQAAFAEAVALHQAGNLAGAEQKYRSLLATLPAFAPALCNLGVILVNTGRLEEAERTYNLALAHESENPDAHFNLGNLYRRTNRLQEAADHYQTCLVSNPNHASAAFNLGLVLATVGDLKWAIECFQTVVRLEPGSSEGYGRLGDALLRSGQMAEALKAFRKALELKPNDPRNLYNLGLALSNAGQIAEAREHIQKALKIQPGYAEAHNALGLTFEALGQKDDALFHYQQAVSLKPDLADGWSNLGTNLSEQGRIEDAINCLRESLNVRPNAPPIHSNYLLLLNYSSKWKPADIRDEHFKWAERYGGPTADAPKIPEPHDPSRRLKIGYLSSDFRDHTVSGFIEAVLVNHNRENVEVFAYASVLRPDAVTAKLQALADQWRPVGGLPDSHVFDAIRADNLDVLIDLGGHTAGNRLLAIAHRPAPIQVTLFGYPNTTGLKAVDYRITDAVSDPPGFTDTLYAETNLRLPEVPWVYHPPANAPPLTSLPAAKSKQFTFGCLNNAAKISELCLETWVKLLQTTPGTKLVVMAGQSKAGAKQLTDRFYKAGVLRERIEIVGRLPKDKYFEKYREFDVSLDPFPYNGGVTTVDSMWMGVPVLTLAGDRYLARQGAMLNAILGLKDFTADNPAGLLKLAKEWTTKRTELAAIRVGLRDRVAKSPVTDARRYTSHLEAALRQVWLERLNATGN